MTVKQDSRSQVLYHFAVGLLGADKAHELLTRAQAAHDPLEYARRFGLLVKNELAELRALRDQIRAQENRVMELNQRHLGHVESFRDTHGPVFEAAVKRGKNVKNQG